MVKTKSDEEKTSNLLLRPTIRIILSVVVVVVLFVMNSPAYAQQQQQQQKNITTTSVMGLTTKNINDTLDSQRLLLDRAMLHKANNTGVIMDGNDLLQCIQTLLLHGTDKTYKIELGNCDGFTINRLTIKNNQFDPGYDNNQTLINLAHAYLKARGIQ